MARVLADQLRPLAVAWLLLTLPVLCHHETAVTVLGLLSGRHDHQHAAVSHPADHHTAHGTTGGHAASSLDSTRAPHHGLPAAEWCTGPSLGSTGILPGDGFAFVGDGPPWAADAPLEGSGRAHASMVDGPPHLPPIPPPRLLA